MKSLKKTLFAGAAAAALLAATPVLAACELKIGVIGGLSGATAQWGLALKGAAEYLAAEANAAGGGGLKVGNETCKITTVAVDSKATAEGAAAATNQLVSQNVKFILGPVVTPEATGIKPIALRNKLLVFQNSFAKDAIGPRWPLVFHEGPGPSVWAGPIVKVAKEKFNIKKVVLVAPNDQGGTDITSVDIEAYKANGIEATEEFYQRGNPNFAAVVARVLAQNPDTVDTSSTAPGDAGVLVKQLRQAGFTGTIGRLGGPATDEILRVAGGPEVLKNFYWYENVPLEDPNIRAIATDYKKLMNADPPENTMLYLWVGVGRLLFKAISDAGTITDTEKVAEMLRKLPIDDKNLGKGRWTGKSFFGIQQEVSFPFGIGLIVDGKVQPILRAEVPEVD